MFARCAKSALQKYGRACAQLQTKQCDNNDALRYRSAIVSPDNFIIRIYLPITSIFGVAELKYEL